MIEGPYLRFPSISGERLALVADDDVWLAPSGGGIANRLTSDHAPASDTRLSPDGQHVAYTGRRDGQPEVYVVATDGGEVRRLTYWGDLRTRVIGWTAEGNVIAISATDQPFSSRTWAYAISLDGSEVDRLPYGPISGIAHGPGGAVVVGVNQSVRRGAAWKRYRGGTAGKLWIDRRGSGEFVPLLAELDGQLEDPTFVGERLVFVSDHEGFGNVYSVLPDGSDLRRHTDSADYYVRAASSDGATVVYQRAGEIWRLDGTAADSEPSRLEIRLGSPRSGRARRFLKAAEELGDYSPDHSARASAVEARGAVFWLTHKDGPAPLLGGGDGVRARVPRVTGAGEQARVVFATDAEGDDSLEVAAISAVPGSERRRIGTGQLGRVLELAISPDGKLVAIASHHGAVILVEIESGELRTVDSSSFGDATGLTFAPDSKWLAWSAAGPSNLRNIKLAGITEAAAAAAPAVVEVTPLRFNDHDPAFSPDGKYLFFLSARTFDPVYDNQVFDMSFVAATRPYLVTLAADTPSPFDPELAGRPREGVKEAEGKRPQDGGAGAAAGVEGDPAVAETLPPVRLDVDGMGDRVVAFPVAAGRYSRLRAAAGGALWLSEPLLGVLGEERAQPSDEKARARIVRYDFTKRREVEIAASADSFEVAGDGKSIVLRDGERFLVKAADVETHPGEDKPDPDSEAQVDLSRIRVEIDPPVEWRQMYDEAARLMRDLYWVEDMAGVDWPAATERYRPFIDRIATRDDLSDLIWEMHGELGSSHAYEQPPERPVDAERKLGFLGADLERSSDGNWLVRAVVPGESSVPTARSPLLAPAVSVRPGDAIVAVDGRPVDPEFGPPASLAGTANKPVELAVVPAGGGDARRVLVQPLPEQTTLRYHAWVAGKRATVHRATDGRVGYLHVPDMMGLGWAQLHRDLRMEVSRDGLIVDVRDNRGGHVSELVLEKIERVVRGWDLNRYQSPVAYPSDAPRGPRILITNEQAGSDGDIVTAGFKQRGLGPVVGTRTWGGVIGIDGRYNLVDRSMVTQPAYSFWFYDQVGWGVENYGVDPDVEVPIAPQDWAAGRDPQLDKALEMIMAALESEPVARPPDPATRPSRAAPPLPPRPTESPQG